MECDLNPKAATKRAGPSVIRLPSARTDPLVDARNPVSEFPTARFPLARLGQRVSRLGRIDVDEGCPQTVVAFAHSALDDDEYRELALVGARSDHPETGSL
jgi:hypothetical protein